MSASAHEPAGALNARVACMLACRDLNVLLLRIARTKEKEQTAMHARGTLMREHRLIERMLSAVQSALAEIDSTQRVDPAFVDVAVDFVQTYADRTHHGKEEDILFRELDTRDLSAEDRRAMDELIADHALCREMTKSLVRANEQYRDGDKAALATIVSRLRALCDFYPTHIEKENKIFFPAARAYFTDDEDQAMLARFWAFDRAMIHEKYARVVAGLENR